jgi:serine protease AprX
MNPAKIDNSLQNQVGAMAGESTVPVIVMHRGDVFFSQAVGGVKSFDLISAKAMAVRTSDIAELSDSDRVEYIWPDLPVHTCLDHSIGQIQVAQVWEAGFRGTGIKLGIVDTGIDANHPDFVGRIVANKSFVTGEDTHDYAGHGTHVASIAAGSGAKSNGKYRGVAPEASLYIAKVLNRNGGGSMSDVMAGIEWAVQQGVQVINLSLGSSVSCDGTDALSTMCDAAVQQRGIVLCVAAGNEGPNARTVGSPGCAREVITVGSVNENNQISTFSSRGPTADGRIKPDIIFPGEWITAAQSEGTQAGQVVESGYVALRGTSMATPHTAGSVCLLLQAKSDLTPYQVKQLLTETAQNLGQPGNTQGSGLARVFDAFGRIQLGQLPPREPGAEPTPEPEPEPEPEPQPEPQPEPSEPPGCLRGLFSMGRR